MKRAVAGIVCLFAAGLVIFLLVPAGRQTVSQETKTDAGKKPNRLIKEKSPYLLQHAHNPVDWYPWGEEAFEKARKEDKPIFLSIGYSTCHWCHVMEKECFSDPEVAELMNEVFVSIKVDREERPDIDNIYMGVCQMIGQSCGWPLTIIMTPDKKPFFAATYIPKQNRFGQTGMMEIIPRIKDVWGTQRDKLLNSARQITQALQAPPATAAQLLNKETLKRAYAQLEKRFDSVNGGFGSAPKFPTPHNFLFLFRYWKRTGEPKALNMAEKTLSAMRRGGIYDHAGFGFHRYSTDPQWLLPHFEKMLYDQALISMAYTEAYQATGKKEYGQTTREILTYVLRDMTSREGGFYSAEDADSEGEEGKFYLWTPEEILSAIGEKDGQLFMKVFNGVHSGNFVEQSTGKKTGANILHLKSSIKELAGELKIAEGELQKQLENARQKLFSVREKRIHPYKDDKILTDWNGLMIAALAKAAQAFDEPQFAKAAQKAADFILKRMRKPDGRLMHRYRDGEAGLPAHVDDYAFLIWGLLELYEATFEVRYLQTAMDLNQDLIKHFWDEKQGGFYFTANDGEKLLARQKEIYDGAVPSGNSVAMLNLLRLGRIAADTGFEEKAQAIGTAFSGQVSQSPSAFTQLMMAVDFSVGPSFEVVIAGNLQAEDTRSMLKTLRAQYAPNKVILFRPDDQESPDIALLATFTKNQKSIKGKATAYVCLNYVCELPTTDVAKMVRLLHGKK